MVANVFFVIIHGQRDLVDAQAQVIHHQSVVTRVTPIGNLTGITDEEGLKVASWYAAKTSGL